MLKRHTKRGETVEVWPRAKVEACGAKRRWSLALSRSDQMLRLVPRSAMALPAHRVLMENQLRLDEKYSWKVQPRRGTNCT